MNPVQLTTATTALIWNRRSVRSGFEDRAVSREVIEEILWCGLTAPSSKNARPWRFHAVSDRTLLCKIADAVDEAERVDSYVPIDPITGRKHAKWESTVHESAQVLRDVPLAIFVENEGRFSGGRGAVAAAADHVRLDAVFGYGLEMLGHGAAIETLVLAAAALGLSGVFIGDVLIAERTIARHLDATGDLVGVVALGYAPDRPRRDRDITDEAVVWHD